MPVVDVGVLLVKTFRVNGYFTIQQRKCANLYDSMTRIPRRQNDVVEFWYLSC